MGVMEKRYWKGLGTRERYSCGFVLIKNIPIFAEEQ